MLLFNHPLTIVGFGCVAAMLAAFSYMCWYTSYLGKLASRDPRQITSPKGERHWQLVILAQKLNACDIRAIMFVLCFPIIFGFFALLSITSRA